MTQKILTTSKIQLTLTVRSTSKTRGVAHYWKAHGTGHIKLSCIFFRSKDVLKKRNNTAREVWSTSPLRSSPLLQSIAQQAITSPIVATPKLSKRGELYMCSECPYSGEKLMTALDHMKKKHQFKGTLEDILDKETYNQCGQTSLRVAQGKFYESLHGKLG